MLRNYIKGTLCLVLLLTLMFAQKANINATDISYQLNTSLDVRHVDVNGNSKSITGSVAYGSLLQFDFNVKNASGDVQSKIGFTTQEGIKTLPYFYGVLKIGDKVATEGEYRSFLVGTLPYKVTENKDSIKVIVSSIGSARGTSVGATLTFKSNEVTYGRKQVNKTLQFAGTFAGPEDNVKHRVRIFDGKTLLTTLYVSDNEILNLDTPIKEGYDFVGFNYAEDASKDYYDIQHIRGDVDLFAVFKPCQYIVTYYIDDEIYARVSAQYGEDIPNVKDPSGEGVEFTGWNIPNVKVYSDMSVFGSVDLKTIIVKPSEERTRGMLFSYQVKQAVNGSSELLDEDGKKSLTYAIQKPKSALYKTFERPRQESAFVQWVLIVLPFALSVLISGALYYFKKTRRNKMIEGEYL